jgi:predicted TIM-barrel fold metal-dependent hydrolase
MKLNRVLDGDGHIIERDAELFEYLEPPYRGNTTLLGYPFFPTLDGYNRGAVMARMGIHQSYEITPQLWVDTLDKAGLESTVLYPTAGLAFTMIQDPIWAVALARAYNDWFTDRYYRFNKRLRGMALIPLQDVPEAVKELRRAVTDLGMMGAVLPANDADIGIRRGLGHPHFWPIYEEAEKLGVPVATHGAPSMNLGINSFTKFGMTIALEHPIAQMIQITSFVMEGVFDRFQKLRVGFLEAGTGWVPYMMDRLDRSYEVFKRKGKQEFSEHLKTKPSEQFASGRMYFSCEGGEPSLRNLVDRIGHKGLLFASDFPHEANLEHAMHEMEELLDRDDLSEDAKKGIFCDNIERFYARA